MHRIEATATGVSKRRRVHRREGKTFSDQTAADTLVCVATPRQTVVVQLVDVVAAIAVLLDEEPVIDLVQGHTTGSPYGVCGTSAISHTANKRRVTGKIICPQRIARRDPCLLCVHRKGHEHSQRTETQ